MPRSIDPAITVEATALLVQGLSASEVARQLEREHGQRVISHTKVAQIAEVLNIDLPRRGRPVGTPHAVTVAELSLYEEPRLSMRDMAQITGLSPQRVHQLLTDGIERIL